MRRFVAAVVLSIASLVPGQVNAANTWGTDLSDLWWNPNESGWGAHIAHQGEIIFMTLYVYGPDSRVKWYSASGMASQGGSFTFTGPLYETTGPYLGAGNFDPTSVNRREVGTATLVFQEVNRATLTYSVDGVNVSKSIERNTFRNNDLSGSYLGAAIGTSTGCGANSGDFSDPAPLVVGQTGSNISIVASISSTFSCTYSGTYTQSGRMGSIAGSLSCTNGAHGTFQAFEIEAGHQAFSLRYSADYGGGCTETGRIGGLK